MRCWCWRRGLGCRRQPRSWACLHESQLYEWRVKARAERDQSETERNQAAEIARLKRKVADQAEELAIVKKAAAYFAKSLK